MCAMSGMQAEFGDTFEMIYLDGAKTIIGYQICRARLQGELWLNRTKYATDIHFYFI